MLNQRAQIAETVTWVVATIAIIVIILISVLVVQFNLKDKKFSSQGDSDLLITKSMTGYLLTKNVYGNLQNLGEEDSFNPIRENIKNSQLISFATKVFRDLYSEEYPDPFWIGVVHKDRKYLAGSTEIVSNTFGARNDRLASRHPNGRFFYNHVKLNDELVVELILVKFRK